jgi:hypothetical protein
MAETLSITGRRSSCLRKRVYMTKDAAATVARKREARGAPPLRAYKCLYCPAYHLTKQPLHE